MADLSRSYGMLLAACREIFGAGRQESWLEVRAAGCDTFDVSLRGGRVVAMSQCPSLEFGWILGKKKSSSWMVGEGRRMDLSFLQDLPEMFRDVLQAGQKAEDPRRGNCAQGDFSRVPAHPYRYDPQVAMMSSAMVFRRMYEMYAGSISRGIVVDADISWHHGRILHDGRPSPCVFADGVGWSFAIQTQMDDRLRLIHPERLHLRRHLSLSAWSLSESFSDVVDAACGSLDRLARLPLCAWDARNFDRIVFMPSAVSQIVGVLICAYEAGKVFCSPRDMSRLCICLGSDPGHSLYAGAGEVRLDACGNVSKAFELYGRGAVLPTDFLSRGARFGHCLDASGHVAVLYPVLYGAPVDGDAGFYETAEGYSRRHGGRILFVERVRMRGAGDSREIGLDVGGIVCRDGEALCVVAPRELPLSLSEWLLGARAFGGVGKVGGMAVCAVEI